MATDTANNQHRRIDDRLPGQSLRWDDAQGGDNEEPLDPQLQRIVDAFMPEADNDPDPELRAGGPKRLIAFDYFKRGYLAHEQSSTAGATRQGGVTSLEGLETFNASRKWLGAMERAKRGNYLRRVDVERLLAAPSQGDARVPMTAAEVDDMAFGYCPSGNIGELRDLIRAIESRVRATAPAPQADEILALHRQLAAEKLRADQGWERAESKSKECIELRERMAAPAPQQSELSSAKADEEACVRWAEMHYRHSDWFDATELSVAINAWHQACAYVRAKAAQAAPGAPTAMDALREMVRWFGKYPVFVPADECFDKYKAAIKQAEDCLASKAAPSAKAELVRYEYRVTGFGGAPTPWRETSKERAEQMIANPQVEEEDKGVVYEVRALYAAPAPAVQAEDVRNQAKWISVDEREPEEGQKCIVLIWPYNNRENEQIECIADYIDGTFMNHEGDDMHPPSHWMPFPDVARPAAPSTSQTREGAGHE